MGEHIEEYDSGKAKKCPVFFENDNERRNLVEFVFEIASIRDVLARNRYKEDYG
ncbi:MAG: hypothetical protein KGQ58_05815 [Proteobacteria bacterium]|nr:hypothetical protein [Pseudomonadota bacterium]MDE3208977.1 hypothetical protein [Pseudomonadota bacterium]